MHKPKKILIVRFSSLGDIILTLPAIYKLHEKFPEAQIDYLTKNEYKIILENISFISNIITIEDDAAFKQLRKIKEQLKQSCYNIIVDFHNNLRSIYIRAFLNSNKLVFKKYHIRKLLLVKFKINLMKALPSIKDRYINIISSLITEEEISKKYDFYKIYHNDKIEQTVNKIFTDLKISLNKKLICIAPSSKHFTKTYPPELYVKLINSLDNEKYNFILTGKGNDDISIKQIKSHTGDNVYDLCNKLNLLELTEIIKRCSLFISGDTGPMHIAEALSKPIIMLAGSSVKELGFFPQSDNIKILEADGLRCRPCSHIGRSLCPKRHFKCMRDITPEKIFSEIHKLIHT